MVRDGRCRRTRVLMCFTLCFGVLVKTSVPGTRGHNLGAAWHDLSSPLPFSLLFPPSIPTSFPQVSLNFFVVFFFFLFFAISADEFNREGSRMIMICRRFGISSVTGDVAQSRKKIDHIFFVCSLSSIICSFFSVKTPQKTFLMKTRAK